MSEALSGISQNRRRSISREQKSKVRSNSKQAQITLDSTENKDIKNEQKSLEIEKRIKDIEISKLMQEKDFYMKSAIQNNNKLKEMKKSKLNGTLEENDQLKNEVREQRQKEQELEVLVKNQKEQIKDLEKSDPQSTPQIDMKHQSIDMDYDQQDFQNANSSLPVKKKYPSHSLNKTGATYKYLSDKKSQPNQNITLASPFQKKIYPHQIEPSIDIMNTEGSRNLETPREKYRRKKHSFRNSDIPPIKQDDSSKFTQNTQITVNEFSPARANVLNVNLLNPEDNLADQELENATREELLNAIKILKKQNQTLERKHKNEIEALKFRIQRVEMEQKDNSSYYNYKDTKIQDLENKLKDKEKELEMVYMKIKNNSNENNPYTTYNSSKKPLALESLNLKESNSQISKPINKTQQNTVPPKFDMDTRNDVRNQIGNGFQNADEELLKSTTHGKLKRIIVWSNNERIHGVSFQYLKHDGSILEPNINIFSSKNLRTDYMEFDVDDDKDYVEEIQGKYNIKGVKDLIITSPTGKTKHFKPIKTDKSIVINLYKIYHVDLIELENNDQDEVFTVKYDYVEKPLKIVFPNMFYYDMKGARLYDKHDQNFYYIESTRCVSLSNTSLMQSNQF